MGSILLTREGFEKIGNELEWVKNKQLPEAETLVKELKYYGDTSSDYYKEAKEKRDYYKKRINVLEEMLNTATLVGE